MKATHSHPILLTSNLADTITDLEYIGYKLQWKFGDPNWYAALAIDGLELHLRQTHHAIPPIPQLYLTVDNINEMHEILKKHRIETDHAPENQEYGMKDFQASLSGGTIITIGEVLETQ